MASLSRRREGSARVADTAFDLAVIGSGGAAFAAAIRARDLGAKVVMIERGTIGGTCVNVGCVPSKTLIRAGETRHRASSHLFDGVITSVNGVDLGAAVAQKNGLVDSLRQAKYIDLLGEYGIDLIRDEARFAGPEALTVAGETVPADRVVVATGARPDIPPIPGLADADPLTSTTALELGDVPRRLVVIGGGYVALELGQLFAHLGSQVTLIARSGLMRHEEPQVGETIGHVLTARGVNVVSRVTVERIEPEAGAGVTVVTRDEQGEARHQADRILVATGRRANTKTLDVWKAGITSDPSGSIHVGDDLQTANQHVWAAGDVVAGSPQFVYVAAHMGATAAQNALTGSRDKIDYSALPRITFTDPQIAAAGLTDAEAKRRGIDCSCRTLPLSAVPRALVNHDTDGFIKLVIERDTRRLIGATAVAEGAGDLIQAAVLAIQFGLTIDQLATTWAPYLTMSEGLKLAAQIFDRDVTKLSCCAA
jgi:mercuric reductase